jgi:rhodanese-related sulfurtransferase
MSVTQGSVPLEIECRAVKERLDRGEKFLFLDCREPDEHRTAHIEGTWLIPMGQIPQRLEELQPHKQSSIVVHCHHGGRSLRVTHWLRQQGFLQAQNLTGGIDRWATEVDPSVPKY